MRTSHIPPEKSSERLAGNNCQVIAANLDYLKLLKEDEYVKRRELDAYAEKQHERAFFKMIHSMNTESW